MRIKLQHAHAADEGYATGKTGYYFEIQADGNHETLATSEIYNTHRSAVEAIGIITADGLAARIEFVDETADD